MTDRITYIEETPRSVEHTPFYCPNCGKRNVWALLREGESTHGGIYGCTACHESWAMNTWIDGDQHLDTRMIARKAQRAISGSRS